MEQKYDNDRPTHLRLRVIGFCNQPPEEASVHVYQQLGGSIGRDDQCDYVLPDSESMVSRIHALIIYENSEYYLTDQSTNGTFVNDSPYWLESGVAYHIQDGDRFRIGNYLLVANLIPANSPLNKAAPQSLGMAQSPLPQGIPSGESASRTEDYPEQPDMESWISNAKQPDWFQSGQEDDSEVGSDTPSDRNSREERPPVPVLQQHLAQPVPVRSSEVAPETDRSEQEQINRRISGTGVPTGFIPGAPQFEALSGEKLVPGGTELKDLDKDPFTPALDKELYVANQSVPGEPREDAPIGSAAAERSREPKPVPKTTPVGIKDIAGQSAPAERGTVTSVPALGQLDTDLLSALLNGLGSSAFQVPAEKATEFATQIGQLTHEAIRGMIETLRLRDDFKREFYVPVTRIAPTDNNVFKHSANVDDALARAFSGAASSAYMDPVESTRLAFQDIAAHQLALVSGMQAAVAFLLARFSPQALEERIGKASMLDGVLPQIHKAHMWEQFEKEYTRIVEQAEEDFQRVFGQHFEQAYTQQIRQLHSAGFGGRKDPES